LSIIDAAKAQFDGVLSADPKPLKIAEWGGTFYVRPQVSLKKKMEIQQKMTSDKMDEGLAISLIYYLVDGEGSPCFNKADLFEMVRSIDPDVLIRVASEIAELQPKQEELEGN
jgi:hypothetical protein|tara:strand:- start:171 stop:509 length:339 start_codon:yes stop_codon:yes gene_type:complete